MNSLYFAQKRANLENNGTNGLYCQQRLGGDDFAGDDQRTGLGDPAKSAADASGFAQKGSAGEIPPAVFFDQKITLRRR
ncbi:hypothetical protein PbDSM24746_10630 [Paenibacillus macerans]|nr:hypothetical protein PbDSM24746_10630 [Paenibacillus macerans]GBK67361.1 hypothetical protein PbJCM17693_10690 [Paenibacillus macerans]GIP10145.1 hypothetical protein J1TS5_23150 [Paenibacillus macerans]